MRRSHPGSVDPLSGTSSVLRNAPFTQANLPDTALPWSLPQAMQRLTHAPSDGQLSQTHDILKHKRCMHGR